MNRIVQSELDLLVYWVGLSREQIATTWSSYRGHFRHANAYRLEADFQRRFPVLSQF